MSTRLTKDEVMAFLLQRLEQVLQRAPGTIDVASPLVRYGLDSAQAVELVEELSQKLGVELDAGLMWDHPELRGFVDALFEELERPARAS